LRLRKTIEPNVSVALAMVVSSRLGAAPELPGAEENLANQLLEKNEAAEHFVSNEHFESPESFPHGP
jgi:hypothetical protein